MKIKKHSFKWPDLRRCFRCLWLFVALWTVEQQNVYSSRASGKRAAEEDSELETTRGVPDDTMARLHAELAAQQEVTDPQLASLHLTENRCHVIAFTVLFLILIRAVVLLRERERKKKAEEEVKPPREELQPEGEEGKEEAGEEEEEMPVLEDETSPGAAVLSPEEPAGETALPQTPMPQIPVPMPRRKPKADVPEEKQPEERGGDGVPDEGFVPRPTTRTRKTGKEFVRKAGLPPAAPPQVQPGIEEEEEAAAEEHAQQATQPPPVEPTTPQPTLPQLPEQPDPGPAPGVPEVEYMEPSVPPAVVTLPPHEYQGRTPVAYIHEDKELQELRARRNVISNLVNVATMLVNELPGIEARSILDVLNENVDTAEEAERQYNVAKGCMDPNLPLIRSETVSKMEASIGGARDALVELGGKCFYLQVHAYCSEKIIFSDAERLQIALADMMASAGFEMSLLTLARVGNASITLKHENEDQLRILQSLEFVDECGADDFVKVYAAVAAMNYRTKTLERLSALDSALMAYILQAHKDWLMGKLQLIRIPLEMDANLIQEVHVLLSKVRLAPAGQTPSGITNEDMEAVKGLFQQQYQDVQGMDGAKDVEAVKAAYQRANQVNQRLKYILQMQKEKFHSALKRQSLSKEEANAAAEAIAQIAESVVGDTEEFWRSAHERYVQIGGKPEDVLNFAGGKALLQKLSTKIRPSTGEQLEGAVTAENVAADAVKRLFLEQWRKVEALARDHWLRAQETVEAARKVKKYKLDSERFGSSGLDKRTKLRTTAVAKKAETGLPLLRFQCLHELSEEIETYERTLSYALMYPFDPSSGAWNEIRELKSRFDSDKAMLKDSKTIAEIPELVERMLQTSLRAWTLTENERLARLAQQIEKARIDLLNS
ncbi:uncharacterized protein EMH_0063320 [Eimeria mitis]|uniref:Uncharacterized protein n=1 Tax=Eimeria mitis TaxID=44415 RepID=U6JZW0_9EIME|nr:uncharacterized protein EMH_0063320 [Eimeria mitis]CDJ31020.1 hypothetical protein EMH_0063320 [Eimeria mitis]